MAFNGSGTFLINTAGQPVVSGTVISSTAFNALTADLATGLSTAITKDGQTTVTANIPMSTYKFTGLGVGSAAGDSANLSQVQSTVTKLLTSVSGADTITAVGAPVVAAYAAGQMFYFVATGDNTGAVTLNIDALGAKAVTRDGSVALAAGDIKSGEVVVVVYDGTRFQVVSQLNSAGDARFANVSIASSLYVGGVSTFVGNAGFSANVSIASALSVGGVAAITGATTIGGNLTLNGGTANGVLYLNGSKVATSGTALVFDGTNLGIGTSSPSSKLQVSGAIRTTGSDSTAVASSGVVRYVAGTTMSFVSYGANASTPGAFNFTGLSSDASAGDVRATIDSSGNLGLGLTPSAWLSSQKALEVSGWSVNAASLTSSLATNAYVNASSQWIYKATGFATRYDNVTGQHQWHTAPSGTAGNAISFTQAMTLDASGNLGIGTSSPSQRLHVNGSTLVPIANSYFTFDVRFGIGTPDSDGLQIFSGDYTRFGTRTSLGVFTESMRLTTTGLGIGTTTPVARLHSKTSIAENTIIEGTTARGSGSVYGSFYDPTGRKGFWGYASAVDDTFFVSNEMNAQLAFQTNAITRASITGAGNFCAGAQSALATTATNGFLYVPTCAGTPTGVPTAITGMAPIVVNTTNNKLYFYSGGAWRDAGP
jgi:hypothetical protein